MNDQAEQADSKAAEGNAEKMSEQGGRETTNDDAGGDVLTDEQREMQSALRDAEQELAVTREAMLRMQAEMENLRKRLMRDLERSRKFALEQLMNDLLPVRDSLERGLTADAETATVGSLLEGKELILKMFNKALADHGLEEIDPLGETFNPELHEAMTLQPSDEYGENTVMEVLQKGFCLHERLLRPARVVVSKGPATD